MACSSYGAGEGEGYAIVFEEHGSGAWSQVGNIIVKNPSVIGSQAFSVAMLEGQIKNINTSCKKPLTVLSKDLKYTNSSSIPLPSCHSCISFLNSVRLSISS